MGTLRGMLPRERGGERAGGSRFRLHLLYPRSASASSDGRRVRPFFRSQDFAGAASQGAAGDEGEGGSAQASGRPILAGFVACPDPGLRPARGAAAAAPKRCANETRELWFGKVAAPGLPV